MNELTNPPENGVGLAKDEIASALGKLTGSYGRDLRSLLDAVAFVVVFPSVLFLFIVSLSLMREVFLLGLCFGVVALGLGVALALNFPEQWKRWTGYRVDLRENGMVITYEGTVTALRYEQVEAFVTEPVVLPLMYFPLRHREIHRLLVGGRDVLVIHPRMHRGYVLAWILQARILTARTKLLLQQLQTGQEVRFDELARQTANGRQPLSLIFSAEGLRANGGDLMPWAMAGFTTGPESGGFRVARLRTMNGDLDFIAEGYPGATIAAALIEKCIEASRQ